MKNAPSQDGSNLSEVLARQTLTEVTKTRKQANYRILAIILFGALIFSWNVYNTNGLIGSSGNKIPKGEPYVSLVRIRGTIQSEGSASAQFLNPIITKAFEDQYAKGVLLVINSPGGTPVQADLIHDHIVRLKKQYKKPVIAVGEDQLTSGAYMAAVAADKIYVNESTMAGSIGVIAQHKGFHELAEKLGIENHVVTAGAHKYRLNPFDEVKEEDLLKMKGALEKIHYHFIDTVRLGRGDRLNADPEILFSGDWWTGNEVVELGLVDGIGDIQTVLLEEFGVKYSMDHTRRKGLLSGLTETLVSTIVDRLVIAIDHRVGDISPMLLK